MSEENKNEAKQDNNSAAQGPSKMPDLKEIGAMAGKLFTDVKKSIGEIITDYKSKRPETPKTEAKPAEKPTVEETSVAEEAATDSDETADSSEENKPE